MRRLKVPQKKRRMKTENSITDCSNTVWESLLNSSSLKKIQSPSQWQDFLIKLISDQKKHRKIQKKLTYLAYHDSLTGLGNRISFQEEIEALIKVANKKKSKLAILFIDMDHFKHFNDVLGYIAGDNLLKLVARRLSESVPEEYLLFRIGGDEFVLIISDISKPKIIEEISKKILHAFKKAFFIEKQRIFIETSIGISIYPEDGKTIQQLLKNADSALKLAKEIGGNNYQFCSPETLTQEKYLTEIEGKLRKAILRKDLLIFYQPIYSMKHRKFLAFEALLRWRYQDDVLTSEKFIQIAEKKGLVVPLGKWVLKTVCVKLRNWSEKFPNINFQVAVNISPKQLRTEANFLTTVKSTLAVTKVNPALLSFEITENSLMHDIKGRASLIRQLKELGIGIAIDDFGIGYSSLNYIKYFPADILKIDKSFVEHIDDPRNCSIIHHIIAMANSLEMKTIAEGIETKEQYDFLRRAKVDMGQGYFLGKPMVEEEATLFLQRVGG
jgi:diguanylate cyclase (GGDEF)-like protein